MIYEKPKYVGLYSDGKIVGAWILWYENDKQYHIEPIDYLDMLMYCSNGNAPSESQNDICLDDIKILSKEDYTQYNPQVYDNFDSLCEDFDRAGYLGSTSVIMINPAAILKEREE